MAALGLSVWMPRSRAPVAAPAAPQEAVAEVVAPPATPGTVGTPASPARSASPAPGGRSPAADPPTYSLVLLALGGWGLILDADGLHPGRFARDLATVLGVAAPSTPTRLDWPGAVTGAIARDAATAAGGVRGAVDRLGVSDGVIALGVQAARWAEQAFEDGAGFPVLRVPQGDAGEAKRALWALLQAHLEDSAAES